VIIPKKIRERLGVSEGAEFVVEEETDRIILRPVPRQPEVVEKKGVLVVVPKRSLDDETIQETTQKLRDERDRRQW
jgi:AbrB family looped-hinge helix DNA binding protein